MVLPANSPQKVNALACSTRRFALILCFLLGLTLSAAASPSTFDSHADQIAQDIIAQKKSFVFPKVLVIDFPLQTAGINALSSFLADDLSAALDAKLPAGTMIPRSKLHEFLVAQDVSPLNLQSVFIAFWAADKLGANEIITGEVSPSDEALDLRLSLLRLGDAKEAAKWNFAVPFNEERRSKAGKSLEWPGLVIPANPALRCSSENGLALTKAFTDAGGTLLKPTYWPNPPYSEEARRNKLEGSRTYDVFFDAQGNPLLIIPHRPLKPEFDDIAIETIKTWKAQPATMQGKPVACMYQH